MAEFIKNFKPDEVKKVEPLDVKEIKDFLQNEIKGQDEAVEAWARILQRVLTGTPKLRKGPIAVLAEIGPSGVGKTEIAIQAARFLASHGQKGQQSTEELPSLVRIDCGEYVREHEVSKILGSPPGYVGADITPRLAQSEINQSAINVGNGRKVTILIFDEIEKAHEKLSVTLLAALDYGVITMGNNTKTNVEDCIVVFTSNLGNKQVIDKQKQGPLTAIERKKIHMDAMLEHFTPEQLSRMGGETNTVCFNELSREVVTGILLSKLNKLEKLYSEHGRNFSFQVTPGGLENLLNLGYSAREGVRRLETILEQRVSSRLVAVDKFDGTIPVIIDANGGEDIDLYIPKQQKVGESMGRVDRLEHKSTPKPTSQSINTPLSPSPSARPAASRETSVPNQEGKTLAEIKREFDYYGVTAAVNKANDSINQRLINSATVVSFFASLEMQNKMKAEIVKQFDYYGTSSAVNKFNEYVNSRIMAPESIKEVFFSTEMQNKMKAEIKKAFNYYGSQSGINKADEYVNSGIMKREDAQKFLKEIGGQK